MQELRKGWSVAQIIREVGKYEAIVYDDEITYSWCIYDTDLCHEIGRGMAETMSDAMKHADDVMNRLKLTLPYEGTQVECVPEPVYDDPYASDIPVTEDMVEGEEPS